MKETTAGTKVRVLVLRAAGTNCDVETAYAFEQAGAIAELIHINRLRENPSKLKEYQILTIPGGFSYGDDISAGKIFSVQLRHQIGDALRDFVESDKLVLGICNGFQVLVKTGLLPWPAFDKGFTQHVTLAENDSAKFEDRWTYLKAPETKCVFVDSGDIIYLPVAHMEGKFVPFDDGVLDKLKANGQIVFRYVDESGLPGDYPVNPNGSVDDIAGICDPSGRIFGLMPHPERHITETHHPRWTRGDKPIISGMKIFDKAVGYFA